MSSHPLRLSYTNQELLRSYFLFPSCWQPGTLQALGLHAHSLEHLVLTLCGRSLQHIPYTRKQQRPDRDSLETSGFSKHTKPQQGLAGEGCGRRTEEIETKPKPRSLQGRGKGRGEGEGKQREEEGEGERETPQRVPESPSTAELRQPQILRVELIGQRFTQDPRGGVGRWPQVGALNPPPRPRVGAAFPVLWGHHTP